MTFANTLRRRLSARSILLASAATALVLTTGAAQACPLGHDGPRAHLLHQLLQRVEGHAGHAGHVKSGVAVAQAAPAAGQARTEIGRYGRDLPQGAAAPTSDAPPPLDDKLGTMTWAAADTTDAQAKAYFDQGYRQGWAFNHAEAARAFRAAQAADPNCVMCLWGEAWVLGPHINYPMEPAAEARAVAALEAARALAPQGVQGALVEALSKRYSPTPGAERAPLDQAYADAMEEVQARFPEDPHIAVLTADALMNLSPWDYWDDGGRTPKGATERMVALLEGVLGERPLGPLVADPDHPGAIHLYIHAVEASDRPERAAPHAERLEALMPGAGHVVHMPSHIWYRLGRWRDSLDANLRAVEADERSLARSGASLLYAEGYHAHNVHFVMASALMGGDGETAVKAASRLAGIVSPRTRQEVPWTQPIAAALYHAHAHFSTPETILALPEPEDGFPYIRTSWHYARGVALARQGKADEARAEIAAIEELAQTPEIRGLAEVGVPGPQVSSIAALVVEARIAQAAGDHARAAALFEEAAAIQDELPYMEPPFWYYPVHQSLGVALLAQGKTEEAQKAFRAALERTPNNGWAAAGLLRAAEAQGDSKGVAEARTLMERSWFGGTAPELDAL